MRAIKRFISNIRYILKYEIESKMEVQRLSTAQNIGSLNLILLDQDRQIVVIRKDVDFLQKDMTSSVSTTVERIHSIEDKINAIVKSLPDEQVEEVLKRMNQEQSLNHYKKEDELF